MKRIDGDVLKQAFEEIASENLLEELREWFVMTAPLSANRIYGRYVELTEQKEQDEKTIQ